MTARGAAIVRCEPVVGAQILSGCSGSHADLHEPLTAAAHQPRAPCFRRSLTPPPFGRGHKLKCSGAPSAQSHYARALSGEDWLHQRWRSCWPDFHMQEELVGCRRWISKKRFLHALNYSMLLTGPDAHQLEIYIGWLLHRTWGVILAGAHWKHRVSTVAK